MKTKIRVLPRIILTGISQIFDETEWNIIRNTFGLGGIF